MTVHLHCPLGHDVAIDEHKLGAVIACPHCLATFVAERAQDATHAARPEKGKARRRDDDDDDDDDEEDEDDEEEDEKPVKKKARKAAARDEDEDEDDDEEEDDEDEAAPVKWTRKKRQMQVLSNAMLMYLIAFYTMVVLFVLDGLVTILVVIMGVIAMFGSFGADEATGRRAFDTLIGIQFIAILALSPFMLVVYVTMFIAWVMGLFAPAKAEVRTISIVAIVLFLFPIVLYIIFFIFYYALVTRDEVGARLLNMFHTFAFLSNMGALYCSLVSIGRVAAYLGRTTDKNKPMALGWFIVGGFVARVAATGVLALIIFGLGMFGFIPFLIIKAMCAFILNTYYFVINSIRELIEVLNNIRADLHMRIHDD